MSQPLSTRIQRLPAANTETMATHSKKDYSFIMALGWT